jgi:hypothetical protein
MAANRCRFAVAASLAIRMRDRACDLEQPGLIRMTDDPMPEEARLACATDVGRSKTACGHAKHRQVRFLVACRDRLGVGAQDPITQGQQAATLIDLLGYDGGIDRGVMKIRRSSLKSVIRWCTRRVGRGARAPSPTPSERIALASVATRPLGLSR